MPRALFLALTLLCVGCQAQPWQPQRNRASVGQGRQRYRHLPDMGPAKRTSLHMDRGYYIGDMLLRGAGVAKRGAGVSETVIDGHLVIHGYGWKVSGMTIRGDVVIKGDDNDLTGCKVLGSVTVERGEDNRY